LDVTAKGKGVRVDPEKSGLVPKYSKKKEYGKTPTYLTRRKQEEEQAAVDYAQYVQSYQDQNSPYQVARLACRCCTKPHTDCATRCLMRREQSC
jgi:hypothetical protein